MSIILIIILTIAVIFSYYFFIIRPKNLGLSIKAAIERDAQLAKLAETEALRKAQEAELAKQRAEELKLKMEKWNCYLTSYGTYSIRRNNPETKVPEFATSDSEGKGLFWDKDINVCKARLINPAWNGVGPPRVCLPHEIASNVHHCGYSSILAS